jgi:hypothetical protein
MPEKGFFASLFDLSFSSMVTQRIIKVLYVLSLVLLGLAYVFFTIAGFTSGEPAVGALVLLVIGPLSFLFYAIWTRVCLELVMAIFRIMETNTELVRIERVREARIAEAQALPSGD